MLTKVEHPGNCPPDPDLPLQRVSHMAWGATEVVLEPLAPDRSLICRGPLRPSAPAGGPTCLT